jgi:predicted RNase H-like HicB family nuclease
VSNTYTAVYERDGDAWLAKIAEAPHVRGGGLSPGEARQSIRDALAASLETDVSELRIIDDFRFPTPILAAQQEVKATRTEDDRKQMMASMTDSRSAMQWAEDLGISMRDPVTVEALMNLGDRQISVDTFCHTITMAEELSRLTATADRASSDATVERD